MHRNIRLPLALVLFAALGLMPGGCGKKDQGPLKEVRVGYFANLTHAQGVLAVSSGELTSTLQPAKLTTRVFNAGPSLVEALFAGQIDIGYIGPGPAINAFGRSGGKGVRIIAGASANGVLIVARKDSGIQSLADLKGKKIATPQLGNTQDISARHYLTAELKQGDSKNIIAVSNADQVGMMARGQIDAAWVPEPWGSRLAMDPNIQAKVIGEESDIKSMWPDGQLTLAVVITTPEFLEKHPDVVEKFLKVHRSWTAKLAADPQKHAPELGAAIYALTNQKLPEGVLAEAIKHVKFTDDPLEPTLAAMARWAHELGFSQQKPEIKGLVDLTILKKLQAQK